MVVYSGYTTLQITLAMIPTMILVLSLLSKVPGFDTEKLINLLISHYPIISEIETFLRNLTNSLFEYSNGLIPITLISILWSASNGIFSIQKSLQKLDHYHNNSIKNKITASFYTLLSILIIPSLLIFHVLSRGIRYAIISLFAVLQLSELAEKIISVMEYSGIITIVFTLLIILLTYTYLSGNKKKMKDQFPGAIFASVLWIVFSSGFSFFIPRFYKTSLIDGSFAALFLSVIWLRVIIMILYYGAALNQAFFSINTYEKDLISY